MSKIKSALTAIARRISGSVRKAKSALLVAFVVLTEPIGFREVLLLCGSVLLGFGLHPVYPPAAYIAPGIVFVGVAIFGVRS